jgi:predicted nucleotidyltransferase
MSTRAHPGLARLVARAQSDAEVLALILFGSRARHDASAGSDFDVCLVLRSEPGAVLSGAQKRLEYLAEAGADVDLAVFQLLPLAIRIRVLKEGDVLFVRDEDALYDLAARTVRAFEDFRHIHREYLDQVSRD